MSIFHKNTDIHRKLGFIALKFLKLNLTFVNTLSGADGKKHVMLAINRFNFTIHFNKFYTKQALSALKKSVFLQRFTTATKLLKLEAAQNG